MKQFCLGMLLLYFGIKFLVAFIGIIKWDKLKEFEAKTLDPDEKSIVPERSHFVQGLVEHTIMIIISITLYYN